MDSAWEEGDIAQLREHSPGVQARGPGLETWYGHFRYVVAALLYKHLYMELRTVEPVHVSWRM